jgi:hypothetical protein
MSLRPPDTGANLVTKDELRAFVGNLDDRKVIDILNLQPTSFEFEQAVIWSSGDGDMLAKGGHPMTEKVAEIVKILTADEDEPPPVR